MTAAANRRRDHLLLFRFDNRWLDGVLTGAVAALLVATRFGLLACGPWEWDETLFARGLLHFELAAHFPHPPGFPGWLAIGHLLLPFVGEPLRALQLASAALSVIALWPLAALGRRVAAPPVAVAAAALLLVTPGPWLYSVRGFSSTPAATFALAAAAVAVGGLDGRRATLFTVLVAAAFLIRPILLPGLAVLWLAVAAGGSSAADAWLRAASLPGWQWCCFRCVAMAQAEGGWRGLRRPFFAHTEKHFSRLVQHTGGWENVGLVKGLGGGAATLALVAAAALSGSSSGRAGSVAAVRCVWLLVLAVIVVQLLAHPEPELRPLRRAGPSGAGTADRLGGGGAAAGARVDGADHGSRLDRCVELPAGGGAASEPAAGMAERWRSPRGSPMDRQMAVVVEPELYPFASYQWHLLERDGSTAAAARAVPVGPGTVGRCRSFLPRGDCPPAPLRPLARGRRAGVERRVGCARSRSRSSASSRRGSSTRRRCRSVSGGRWRPTRSGVIPVGRRELRALAAAAPGRHRGRGRATGLHPVRRRCRCSWNGEPIRGRRVRATGCSPPWGRTGSAPAGRTCSSFRRAEGYPPGPTDPRPLAVQLLDLAGLGAWSCPGRCALAAAEDLHRHGVRLDGSYPPESFGAAGEGVWLGRRRGSSCRPWRAASA